MVLILENLNSRSTASFKLPIAMAYNIEVLDPLNMVAGACCKYVAEAKRQLFGKVGLDLLAGRRANRNSGHL